MPTVLHTVSRRAPEPILFVGALRPTVGNTVGITILFSAHDPMSLAASGSNRKAVHLNDIDPSKRYRSI